MKHVPLPSVGELASVFEYDPDTGDLIWLEDRGPNAKAGEPAGTTVQKPHGYCVVMLDGKMYKVHRICWKLGHGIDPGDKEVVHVNENPRDNRLCNLKAVSRSVRALRGKATRASSSGVSGVSRDSKSGKWRARLRVKGRSVSLGLFNMREEAAAAVEQARRKILARSITDPAINTYQNEA